MLSIRIHKCLALLGQMANATTEHSRFRYLEIKHSLVGTYINKFYVSTKMRGYEASKTNRHPILYVCFTAASVFSVWCRAEGIGTFLLVVGALLQTHYVLRSEKASSVLALTVALCGEIIGIVPILFLTPQVSGTWICELVLN